jgi:hypothetical protein
MGAKGFMDPRRCGTELRSLLGAASISPAQRGDEKSPAPGTDPATRKELQG